MSSIGPQLPPHLQASTSSTAPSAAAPQDDSDSDDDFGPALPPELATARSAGIGPSRPPAVAGPSKAAVGPKSSSDSRPSYDYDDSDDEVVGPTIDLAASTSNDSGSGVRDFLEREARWAKEREEAAKPKELKREEWMLVPPEAGDLISSLDPLKARGFSRTGVDPSKTKDQTLWTETPAERQQRLQDEISGKKRKAEVSASARHVDEAELNDMKRRKMRDSEIQRTIDQHNASRRAAPLLELHKASSKEKAKTDPSKDPPPIWDRDLHMGVSGRLMDEKDRAKTIRDARQLGDRFGHGKGGAYS